MSARITSFARGIHVPEHKEATTGKPAEAIPAPARVVIPLSQHTGAPNAAIVAAGERVRRGQVIAETPPDKMSAPVHASLAGVVKKIESRPLSNNTTGLCAVIEADGSDENAFMPPLDPFSCSHDEAVARLRAAGLVGMGGAGFPTYVKLNPPPGKKVDVIIADAAEREPYLPTDAAAIRAKAAKIIRGLLITMKITGVSRAIIGMESNKAALLQILEQAIAGAETSGVRDAHIMVQMCKTRYPQGGEKLLITALTGREVPSGGLPADAGCIVQNIGTLIAEADAFDEGKPLIERGLTVSGGACGTPRNIIAPIGTILGDIEPDFFAINEEKCAKIIFGGPMMGTAVSARAAGEAFLDIPIQKNTSGILFLTARETAVFDESPCIGCARCVANCSARLHPVLMNNALDAGDVDEAVKIGLLDCMECGACAYMCPARIRLVQRFRVGKARWREILAERKAREVKK